MIAERQVVISGLGTVTPFGIGAKTFWEKMIQGESSSRLITSFDVSNLPTRFAAQVPLSERELEPLIANQKSLKTLCRAGKFALIAAQEAMEDSGLRAEEIDPYSLGLSLGAGGLGLSDVEHSDQMFHIILDSLGVEDGIRLDRSKIWKNTLEQVNPLTPLKALPNIPTAHIAIQYNARGNCQTISTACTSSTQAVGEAYRQIKFGIADIMITGGSDSMINPQGLISFSSLGVMSKNNQEYRSAARPFDRRRDGFMLGEGAAILILEELEHCRKRGGRPYTEVIGYSSTCDAFRLTDEPPQAWGSIQAISTALANAKVNPESIDYINAHGTGTVLNDKTETFAIKTVFGEKAYSIPVSSTKSMLGHLVAAAGAVELAACVLSINHRCIPPTINYQEPDPECDLDYVPNEAREADLDIVISNSFGFGGQNACLIIRRVP